MNTVDNGISSRRSELSADKQALLEMRLRGAARADAQGAAGSIPRRLHRDRTPLSFAQQRIWFLDQLEPGTPLYNLPAAVRLRGRLNRDALQKALAAVLTRHEALRTCFVAEDGTPAQVVQEGARIDLPAIDLSHLPEGRRETELQRLVAVEIRRPFDLSRDLMLRARLFRLSATEHVFLVIMHHIASDAWSLGVLFRELDSLYRDFNAGQSGALAELPVQYADFALWQRDRLQGELLEEHEAYWRRQLAGLPDIGELPADHPAPPVPTLRGEVESLTLPRELSDALKSLGRGEGATMFMVLLAAFNALLHRYSRQTDILVGSPVAGRTRLETEGLIGFFINTLVLRADLSGNPSFVELLRRVRQMTLDAYAHQEFPFEKLVESLKLERNSTYPPLIRTMFVLQSTSVEDFALSGLITSPVPAHNGTAKFDLTLAMEDTPHGLVAELEYNRDLFEPDTARRMLRHLQTLLHGIAANPARALSELPLLTPPERQQLLGEWRGVRTDYPRDKSIPQLFEEQARRTPNTAAVLFEGRQMTYRELDERANQLARHLQRLGMKPGALIGVCLERSPEMIVALVGILKAGGAYVSLDSTYPRERLALMLEDAQITLLLAQEKLRSTLADCAAHFVQNPEYQAPVIVCVDTGWSEIARESTASPGHAPAADALAYVSFTSGSTGRPKGVCVPHRGVVRLVKNTNFMRFSSDDIFLQLAPIAFDASTLEIWGALLNGAKLAVYPPGVPVLEELGEFVQRHHVTALWLTAGLFHQMIEHQPDSLRGVRQLLAGGDVLSVPHVRKALAALPGCRLINGYGPTENTTFTCCHHMVAPLPGDRSIPIGRPIANTQVCILDEHLQPVPIGVPGELHAGGDGLALGYLNRPKLTADKFIRDPFTDDPDARLYKTGDLVRWLPGGAIEFVGRIDQQVKIRGFRVEPGEVEIVLGQHPAVRECAVVVRADSGEKRLVAYLATDGQTPPTVSEMRDFLERKLPDYMVPAAFVFLPALPLTANGKLDRQALPVPDQGRPELEKKYLAPRDEVELQLTKIWENVLGIQPVGVRDNFFDLGGHSLLAVRLVAQIEKVFGRKTPVATVFQSLTVEQLARVLTHQETSRPDTSIVGIQPHGSKPPLYFVHGVGGGMFWGYTNLARHLGPDQPVYAFNSRGLRGLPECDTIEEMAAQYVADLRAFQPGGPYLLGGYCFGGNVAYEMARQLHDLGEPVALLALINCTPPNSSYNRVRWTPLFCLKFLKNVGYWVKYLLQLDPAPRRHLFVWKLRTLWERSLRLLHLARGRSSGVEVEELVDLSGQPEDRRELWKAHVKALVKHQVAPYAGRITLFRTRGHQFVCSYDPQYGWGELAAGGVTVKIVPGSHESILDEPNVRVVAEELERCLREIQNQSPKERGL